MNALLRLPLLRGLIVGSVLFVPWVIGIVVLSGLIWLTNRRPERGVAAGGSGRREVRDDQDLE